MSVHASSFVFNWAYYVRTICIAACFIGAGWLCILASSVYTKQANVSSALVRIGLVSWGGAAVTMLKFIAVMSVTLWNLFAQL